VETIVAVKYLVFGILLNYISVFGKLSLNCFEK